MPPKMKTPAPIDRPLSRAYLRDFTGWSTAFPPTLSDPSSLRIMRNMSINRDGSIRIRPGLRHLSFTAVPDTETGFQGTGLDVGCIGTHEAFFLNDGTKAYLFAVRETDLSVGFRVLVHSALGALVRTLEDSDFTVPQGAAALNFSSETTYVKYLQIDNKIFALSNAGESMRLFSVGVVKSARKLTSIERPGWDVDDKLTVLKPEASWISSGIPVSSRSNSILNPSFEQGILSTTAGASTEISQTAEQARYGTRSLKIGSKPARTNLVPAPLHAVATLGVTGWTASSGAASVGAIGTNMRVISDAGAAGKRYYAVSKPFPVTAGAAYKVGLELDSSFGLGAFYVLVRYYGTNGAQVGSDQVKSGGVTPGRLALYAFTAPTGAVTSKVYLRGDKASSGGSRFDVREITYVLNSEFSTMFTGSSGANYFWTGAVNDSSSVYHPPADVSVTLKGNSITPGYVHTASIYSRAVAAAATVTLELVHVNASGGEISSPSSSSADSSAAWGQHTVTDTAPALSVTGDIRVTIPALVRGEYHYLDAAKIEASGSVGTYFDGSTDGTATLGHSWLGDAHNSASTETVYLVASTVPTSETPTADTLISSTAASNTYSYGYFYSFENEVGESSPSQITVIKAQRRWSAWKWQSANAAGEPSGDEILDPDLAADQLVAIMPEEVYNVAKSQGAVKWNLYMLTWSDQDSVPPEGLLLETRDITTDGVYGTEGWLRHTPQNTDQGFTSPLPNVNSRYNYSVPSSAGQGLVAADRLILVDDPNAQAVIKYSSNLQGEYTNFSSSKGGGYKTLTSGNLYIPMSVKLWQNPQSVDTLTILCSGVDGLNTSYYMAPASVSQQSETVTVMGFEETTASPGTTSPYGCEVLNNALYHPLDDQLMKSTASNYNISHKAMTDQITNRWSDLENKHRIVSCQHDNRLFYIVHNPSGDVLETDCMGNEIWVFDIATEKGTWSRWKIQASSLRRIEYGGKVYVSVIRPDGIFFLDPDYALDDIVDPTTKAIAARSIEWFFETNTQGANRSHDAWAHLQQLAISFGNLQGTLQYGIRSWDLNGKAVEVSKIVRDLDEPDQFNLLPFDLEDQLQVRRDLKEWHFYASSVLDDAGAVLPSAGQINSVQYRYTPSTVNTGYEHGSVETFEYGRAVANWADRTTDNGIPQPFTDTRRP